MQLQRRLCTAVFCFLAPVSLSGCGGSSVAEYQWDQRLTDIRYALGIGSYAKLETAAAEFLDGTNECILDVRDRGLTYEKSRNCRALEALSAGYLATGGNDPGGGEPTPIRLKGQEALKYVWMARAISELGGGMQNIWIW